MPPDVAFVMVRTAYPSNMGAAARAMMTMGFSDLRLVNPQRSPCAERALKGARAADQILGEAAIFPSLEDATSDADLVIGTTTRARTARRRLIDASHLRREVTRRDIGRIAVVFGPERTGLSNDELARCDRLSSIPVACTQPSLNLAQAIMLYAYELSATKSLLAGDERALPLPAPRLGEESYRYLKEKVVQLLDHFSPSEDDIDRADIKNRRELLHRLAELSDRDLHLVHWLRHKLDRGLGREDKQPS